MCDDNMHPQRLARTGRRGTSIHGWTTRHANCSALTDGKSIGRPVRGQELLPALPADLDGRHSSEEATRCHLFTENSVGARHSLSHMGTPLG